MAFPLDYIGIPFKSRGRNPEKHLDCWGLVLSVYRNELGITGLTDFEYGQASDIKRVKFLIEDNKPKWNEVQQPQKYDIVVLSIADEPFHVGVMLGSDKFIHAQSGTRSCIQKTSSLQWKSRLDSFYRYEH